MKLDEVAAELRALGTEHGMKRLHELADAIDYRDNLPPVTLDEQIAARIRIYKNKNPDVTAIQIAHRMLVPIEFVEQTLTAPKPVVQAHLQVPPKATPLDLGPVPVPESVKKKPKKVMIKKVAVG